MSDACDVMLSLGSSMSVTPACNLVDVQAAQRRDKSGKAGRLIVVNRQPTDKVAGAHADARRPCTCIPAVVDSRRPLLPPLFQDEDAAVRVFCDTDQFMRLVMAHLMSPSELQAWESGRSERLKDYDRRRAEEA